LLDRIVAEVRDKCRADGKLLHWQVFHDRVLGPIMSNATAPSLDEISRKYDIESTGKASNMIITVNRRFQAEFKRHIRRSVVEDSDVETEFNELMQIFSGHSAG
jgi:hypothetical protein